MSHGGTGGKVRVDKEMIRTPTLFILGAGASRPFGYPTGNDLRHKILFGESENIKEISTTTMLLKH